MVPAVVLAFLLFTLAGVSAQGLQVVTKQEALKCNDPAIVEQRSFSYEGDFMNVTIKSCDTSARANEIELLQPPALSSRNAEGCHFLNASSCFCGYAPTHCLCVNDRPLQKYPKVKDCETLQTIVGYIIPQENGASFVVYSGDVLLLSYGTCQLAYTPTSYPSEFCFSDLANIIGILINNCFLGSPSYTDSYCDDGYVHWTTFLYWIPK